MWAFALYDEADGSLLLSRDRFGEKPLYLVKDASGLYFGSEVKFLTALLCHKLEVNLNHVYRYLVNGYKALYKGQHSFFKRLSALPAASILRIDAGGSQNPTAYWKGVFEPDKAMSYPQSVAGARERLIRAVELRLRADVPLAFCMSGGIDSNSLIGVGKKSFHFYFHGFSILKPHSPFEQKDKVEPGG